ncbi:hypothetical protein IV53_GL000795 [Ligilactobacillus ceti DSM 22408]|uniref:HTH araC/xylS-type domain-containing protein n=2 Tax=Ligilactobacillus TaxID=2767887 RepID=A0A0R2KHH5_9LACO|nr:hypothetical protein IV53_GL000795 [Ligilactobacillus ceti DSM 22408]
MLHYIEQNLKKEIDLQSFVKGTAFSYDLLSRLFSILAGISLKQYIRARRLSEAAKELNISQVKINQIANFYGYDSVDSFRYAFKKYHGVTPSQVKKGASYKYFLPLEFQTSLKDGCNIPVEVLSLPPLQVSGYRVPIVAETIVKENLFAQLWEEFLTKLNSVTNSNKLKLYEFFDFTMEGEKVYYLACEGLSLADQQKIGFAQLNFPAGKYAVFTMPAQEIQNSSEPSKYIRETFFVDENDINYDVPDFFCHQIGNRQQRNYDIKAYIALKN